MNSSLVISGVSPWQRPLPMRVTAGVLHPSPVEYQPRIGSVDPWYVRHSSPAGSMSRAFPGVTASGQDRSAVVPSSDTRTSGPK